MTGPLVVLGVLSVGRRLAQPARRSWAEAAALEHWLEPVTAPAARVLPLEMPHGSTEYFLVGAAVADRRRRPAGRAGGPRWRRPTSRPPRRRPNRLRPGALPQVLRGRALRRARSSGQLVWLSRFVLWKGVDQGVVDGAAVNGTARLSRGLGWLGSRLQTGQVGVYVVLFLVGALWILRAVVAVSGAMTAVPRLDRLRASWILHVLLLLPLVGVVPVLLATERGAKRTALVVTILEFVLSLGLWWAFDPARAAMQLISSAPWIPRWGISYRVGIDGISLFMVLLTTVLMPLSVLASWNYITQRERGFYALMLTLLTGLVGVFIALDLFVFYVFFEVMLIPMYFIIGIWGGANRLYAAIKFFIYTMAGSLLMLVAILVMVWKVAAATGDAVLRLRAPAGATPARWAPRRPGSSPPSRSPSPSRCRFSRSTPGCPTPTSRRRPPAACCWPA